MFHTRKKREADPVVDFPEEEPEEVSGDSEEGESEVEEETFKPIQKPVRFPVVYKLETPVKLESGRVIDRLVCNDYPRTSTLKALMNAASEAHAFEIMLDDLFDCIPAVQDMLRIHDSKSAVKLLRETFPNDLGDD